MLTAAFRHCEFPHLIAMAAELVQLQPGTQIERWIIDKKLGEGGFGAVYKVSDSTGQYAMKVEDVNAQMQVCLSIVVEYL